MRLFVKPLGCFTILLLFFYPAHAQLKLRTPASSDIAADIKVVIRDQPNHFKNIMGGLIVQNPQSADYDCTLKIQGAETCTITKYVATDKEIYSWQAQLLTTENFNEAKRKFHSLYTQLNNLVVDSLRLTAKYEAPSEEKGFTNVIFSLAPFYEATKKLKIEIAMENELMEWKIKLLVYEREREDDERGVIVE